MGRVYRIAIADEDVAELARLRASLAAAGHQVVAEANDGQELIQECVRAAPDLVITEIKLTGIDGLQAVEKILQSQDVAVLILATSVTDEIVDRAVPLRPVAYLLKPFRDQELRAVISITMQRFRESQSLREEKETTRQALEDRKLIERAKGLVMAKQGVDEKTAFLYLQKFARDHRQKLTEVAQSLNLEDEALGSK
jgi:response regulator NasT